ncbi:hypothetical protein CHS0354_023804 [Potamilus streckersoni]|uniref:4-hydroxy-tetrahydrodipicolinate reductase n=1 Tax=Potamilus streckersoni TaxID=2493646 RepID=A0AAE0RZN2_9BIVA|nr:hypothetical protein CHS0354_023804 [Potamilus streckersoni]
MRIGLVGKGKMGNEIIKVASGLHLEVASVFDIGDIINEETTKQVDVFIDFTSKDAFLNNLQLLLACEKPLVVGTTGWYEQMEYVRNAVENASGTLLYASNFSLGVQLYFRIVSEASRLIDPFSNFDVVISEAHHTAKLDYPSGTAIQMANRVMEMVKRKKKVLTDLTQGKAVGKDDLVVSSLRVGSTIGEHTLLLDSEYDEIKLTHRAKNRTAFAEGAIVAAKWLVQKRGFFSFDDFINDRLKS